MNEKYNSFSAVYDAVIMQKVIESESQSQQRPRFKKAILVKPAPPKKPKGRKFTNKKPRPYITTNWVGLSKKKYAKLSHKLKTAKKYRPPKKHY